MRSAVSSLALVAVLLTTSSSHAQGAPAPALERYWYGWQIAITAGTSYAIATLSTTTKEAWLFPVSLAGAYAGGPVVHAAHGEGTHALESLGLNFGLTVGGALFGAALMCVGTNTCSDGITNPLLAGGLAGAFLGLVAAQIIDIAVVAHEERAIGGASPGTSSTARSTPRTAPVFIGSF